MGVRSDPAGALHKMLRVPGIPALENQLDATEHLAGAPGIGNLATLNLDFNTKMTLNSGNRIDCYSLTHMFPPILSKRIISSYTFDYISS